ncbi:hypothetical protein NQ038_11835 [Brevibacterium sp. 50QC2O2]|uniref:hypothetical protein n=1 Tax=Brevibacterium TaxID=1696 RepID=UPI00211C7274|nr:MULTISPECIES: hypothetical protein [unclassified Brevibacterium]MCQ9386579.1 hypothetical protein [Brevibacterium sp. 68QC2CO]MCQ9389329.1 hypothetical protein [Brevibacterium sp. 50QC2O2]
MPTGPLQQHQPHADPPRTRTRTIVLFCLALGTGVIMSAVFHFLQYIGVAVTNPSASTGGSAVDVCIDSALGILALALLPSAIAHDPSERLEGYIGPPSALVASLVILCVWMVSVLAAPAGAVVLISVSARLSLTWTAPAFAASVLSLVVSQLTTFGTTPTSSFRMVAGGVVLTALLIGMGSVRGLMQRRAAPEAGANPESGDGGRMEAGPAGGGQTAGSGTASPAGKSPTGRSAQTPERRN